MKTLLDVKDLHIEYRGRGRRSAVKVIHGIDLSIAPGETVSLVGESGSGKSTIGKAILGLTPVTEGSISFKGQDITHVSRRRRGELAADIQAIFQDPYSSLNPSMTVEEILVEPMLVRHQENPRERIQQLLERVNLPKDAGSRLASEFSGGQRQRIAIARALALNPELVVCDEPTSALDVSTQIRILELLQELQEDTGVSYLFISHDLGVVSRISHRVAVLKGGLIAETGPAERVMTEPEHPYTQRLLLATPVLDPSEQERRREQRRAMAENHQETETDAPTH